MSRIGVQKNQSTVMFFSKKKKGCTHKVSESNKELD